MGFTPNADELLVNNASFASRFDRRRLASRPQRRLVVVTCMDTRIDVLAMLGLEVGEAHVLRNAGGVITDDVVRSLCLSQRKLGTREIVLVHHTDCGLEGLDESEFGDELEGSAGSRPSWPLHAFSDPYDDVRRSMRRLVEDPFVAHTDHVRGFVYDVEDGRLREVHEPDPE